MLNSRRKVQACLSFTVLFLMALALGCNGFFVDPTLVSIAVTPPTPTLVVGGATVQMTAFGTFDDGSKKNINSSVTWTMNPPGFATIDKGGMLTGTSPSPSTVTLQASQADVVGSTTFQVFSNITAINVTPSTQSVSASSGTPFCLQATATTSTGQQDISATATWTFTDPNNQTVSGISKTTGSCTGQAFSIGTLQPTETLPVTLNAVASAPSSNGGTINSNTVKVGVTQ
jgi:trimeric autotransporter adhesin